MICSECTSYRIYRTGDDEYPPLTMVSYCSKGHWDCEEIIGEDLERDCPDFIKKETL